MGQVERKNVSEVDIEDELAGLLAKNMELQEKENADDFMSMDYILLAKQGSKALKRNEKDLYIQGLSIGDFYLQKQKINLGNRLKVVPLAFITVYNELDKDGMGAQFFGIWNKEQAITYPLVDGSYYTRKLPNGHVLVPSSWVCVEVLDHPEIERGVIAYKKTGSRIWKAWKTDAKERGGSSATLVYDVIEEYYNNKDGQEWTDIDFNYDTNLLDYDKQLALKCLKKSNEIREAYEKGLFTQNKEMTVTAPAKHAEIAAPEDVDGSDDSEDVDGSDDSEELGF